MAVNNAVNLVPTISDTSNQIAVTQAAGASTATVALTSPFFNTAQPLFSARVTVDISNVTGDGTTYTVVFDTADLNQGSSYNTSTGMFTAPSTANYLFVTDVVLNTAGTITTTSSLFQNSSLNRVVSYIPLSVTTTSISTGGAVIMPMTASQTVSVGVLASGAAKTTTVKAGVGQSNSYFSGFLLP